MAEVLAATLGRFAAEAPVGPDVIEDAERRVLDCVGVALAAADDPAVAAARAVAAEWGGAPQAVVWAGGGRLPAASAALVNGTMAHALDFDDTHLPSVLHPSASVVPAALAVGEVVGASGAQVLAAVAVGIEVCVRVGMASYDRVARNHVFFDKGLHATSICGTLGAAAAAARLQGLGAAGAAHSLGIAASMGAGIIEANRTGGSVKRIHCGWAAHAGISAASLARHGLTGPSAAFEGRFGFFRALSDDRYDPAAVTAGLGSRWEAGRVFFKPYPTNHFTHAGIDAALALKADGLDPAAITDIELGLPEPVLRSIAEPAEDKAAPATGYAAKFSGPATVAAALLGGGGLGVGHGDFTDEAVSDRRRVELARRVRCLADDEAGASFPEQFPGVLRVFTAAGAVREKRILHNRGGPENPLGLEELMAKFEMNAGPARVGLRERIIGMRELDTAADLWHHL